MLLLCDNFGAPCSSFSVYPNQSIRDANGRKKIPIPVNTQALLSGMARLIHYLIPPRARHLYESLANETGVVNLGSQADVGIGYVTGFNHYFHLSEPEALAWRIPKRYLKPALLALGSFKGADFRVTDWKGALASGEIAFLLALPDVPARALPQPVRDYLASGERQGVPARFKCRVREPWYSVRHVRVANAFLSYMSGVSPRLVANSARAVAPNTLHLALFQETRALRQSVAGWYSPLTRLSCELEGNALGGGMLKLEPSEAERVLIALPSLQDSRELFHRVDATLRRRSGEAVGQLVDMRILRRLLGLSANECAVLGEAADQMLNWRLHR